MRQPAARGSVWVPPDRADAHLRCAEDVPRLRADDAIDAEAAELLEAAHGGAGHRAELAVHVAEWAAQPIGDAAHVSV